MVGPTAAARERLSGHIAQIAANTGALHHGAHGIFAGENNPIEFFQLIEGRVQRAVVFRRRETQQAAETGHRAAVASSFSDGLGALAFRARDDHAFPASEESQISSTLAAYFLKNCCAPGSISRRAIFAPSCAPCSGAAGQAPPNVLQPVDRQ